MEEGRTGRGAAAPDALESGQRGAGLGPGAPGALPLPAAPRSWADGGEGSGPRPGGAGNRAGGLLLLGGQEGEDPGGTPAPGKPVWLPPPWLSGEEPSQAAAWPTCLSECLSAFQGCPGWWEQTGTDCTSTCLLCPERCPLPTRLLLGRFCHTHSDGGTADSDSSGNGCASSRRQRTPV